MTGLQALLQGRSFEMFVGGSSGGQRKRTNLLFKN